MADAGASRMVARVRQQAEACGRLGSPLYLFLLDHVADDVQAGGPSADLLRGHENDSGPSGLALRLMGGAHRLVLERRAPALALTYPSVGGTGDPDAAWAALRDVLVEHHDELRAALAHRRRPTRSVGPPPWSVGCCTAGPGRRASAAVRDRRQRRAQPASRPVPVRVRRRTLGRTGRLPRRPARPVAWSTATRSGTCCPSSSGSAATSRRWTRPRQRAGCGSRPTSGPTNGSASSGCAAHLSSRRRSLHRWCAPEPATSSTDGAAPRTTTVVWHSIMWQYLDDHEQARAAARLEDSAARHRGPPGSRTCRWSRAAGSGAAARVSRRPSHLARRSRPGARRVVPARAVTTWE